MKTSLLSKEFQLDVLFRENQNMRQKIFNNCHELNELKYTLKRKKNHINQLNAEKKRATKKLEKQIKNLKSKFLNYMSKDDNISIKTTMIEKRRRVSSCELKKIL
jgi:iron-sulfur cluster repair protein YtfE (RIC family)